MIQTRRMVIIAILVIVCGLVALSIYLLTPRASLTFSLAPDEVSVKINDEPAKNYKNTQKISIKPGDYTFVVSKNEFAPYTKKMTIKNGDNTELLVALDPQTDAATSQLDNPASQAIVEAFKGILMSNTEATLTKNNPIISSLPIIKRLYRIDACPSVKYPDDETKIALCVTTTSAEYDTYALQAIRSLGYEPDNFEIIYSVKTTDQ